MSFGERFTRYRLRVLTAGMVVLLITGCGTSGGSGDKSPTATATVWPTVNDSVEAPASPDAVAPWQLSGSPTAATTATPSTGLSTPGASVPTGSPPVAVASTVASESTVQVAGDGTPVVPVGSTSPAATKAVENAPTATTAAESTTASDNPVVHEANPTTGDGTGVIVGGTPKASPVGSPSASPAAAVLVSSCDVPDAPAFTGSDAAYITTSEVNIRIGPGTDCDPAADILAQGTLLEVTSDPVQREDQAGTTWVRVTVDGIEGWISTEFLAHDS